jgi:ketosteroid isomerase-like protein
VKVASFYAKDAVVTTPGVADWEGRDMIRDEEAKMFQEAKDAKFGLRRVLVRDDVAVVEWTSTGTLPLPKQRIGRRFGANGVSVMFFGADGLIREEHDIQDSSTLDAQLRADKRNARETLMQPTGTPDVRVARGTPDEEKNVGTAEALHHAFESRDERAFADALTDDVVWDDYTAPAPLRGRTETVRMFQALTTAFPDMKMTCEAWAVDDFVVKQCIRSATQDGVLVLASKKIPPTHAHVSIHFVDVLQMKHGAVAKVSHYADSEELADELRQNMPMIKKKKKKE